MHAANPQRRAFVLARRGEGGRLKPPSFCRNGTFRARSETSVRARFLPCRCASPIAPRGESLRGAIGPTIVTIDPPVTPYRNLPSKRAYLRRRRALEAPR
jgi:hypothetical protein